MGNIEEKLEKENLLPKVWMRYVDDIFAIVKKNELDILLNILNQQHTSIKFTIETEINNKLPFLDLLLTRNNNNCIDISIYRKPTNTNRYITNDSHCPRKTKMAAFHSMVFRLCKLPLSIQNYMNELKKIKEIADVNGYYEKDIDFIVKKHAKRIKDNERTTLFLQNKEQELRRVSFEFIPQVTNHLERIFKQQNMEIVYAGGKKLKTVLGTTKDKLDNKFSSGIYSITCEDCQKIYVGQTKRNILTRYKEHSSHIKYNRPSKSAVAHHVHTENHFNISDSNLKLLKRVNKRNYLDAWESIEMRKNENNLMNVEAAPIQSSLINLI